MRTCSTFSSISRAANSSQTRCHALPTNGKVNSVVPIATVLPIRRRASFTCACQSASRTRACSATAVTGRREQEWLPSALPDR